jgi:hypothetical protein
MWYSWQQERSLSTMPWKGMRMSGCSDCFLDLSNSWWWVVSFTPQQFYPRGISPWFLLDRRLGGHQSWSGWHGAADCSKINYSALNTLQAYFIPASKWQCQDEVNVNNSICSSQILSWSEFRWHNTEPNCFRHLQKWLDPRLSRSVLWLKIHNS